MNIGGKEVQEGENIYIYLWLIHVNIWQKPRQFHKATILHIKKNKYFKKELNTKLLKLFGL